MDVKYKEQEKTEDEEEFKEQDGESSDLDKMAAIVENILSRLEIIESKVLAETPAEQMDTESEEEPLEEEPKAPISESIVVPNMKLSEAISVSKDNKRKALRGLFN
jgi:hypothetical protein